MGKHYVPRHYLRAWQDPNQPGCIWQFDKQSGKFSPAPIAISQAAQGGTSFYSDEDEQRLTNLVEVPGQAVLDKLRSKNFDLTDNERFHLAAYMATMLKRVPRSRERGEALAPKVLLSVTDEIRTFFQSLAEAGKISDELAAKRLAETDAVEAKYKANAPQEVVTQIESPWPTVQMIETLAGMYWRYIIADASQLFLTTDNPLFFFECWGIGTDKSEITFPVSPEICLVGSFYPMRPGNHLHKCGRLVKEVNRRLVSSSRFLYFKSKAAWIELIGKKQNLQLCPLPWAR
jgi:hypothetical protein